MTETANSLQDVRRPRLLVRAARFGLADYVRERDLKRVFGPGMMPAPGRAMSHLIEREAEIEAIRATGGAGYSAARHVEVLTALIAESCLVPESLS